MALKISRILHAGYLFECLGTQIVFDPIFENPFSGNCHAYPNVRFDHDEVKKLKLDAVFVSHFHDDHCSLESLNFLDRQTPIFVYCVFDELFSLIKDLGFLHVHQLKIDVPIVVGSFEIIPRKALDSDVDSIFQIKAAGLNVLNVVDSWIDSSTLEQLAPFAPWDMVLWPFQTMREIQVLAPSRANRTPDPLPSEWIEQLITLNPRYIVPSSCQFIHESWSWYNHALFPISYQQFRKEIESSLPKTQVIRLNPSIAVILDQNSLETAKSLKWVHAIGEQDVDYEYNASLKIPSTSDIAKQFAPITSSQTKRVYDYCSSGLVEKYKSMEMPTDLYFRKKVFWRLSVYDHTGDPKQFYYKINGENIDLASENDEPLSWTTEIPISKLYGALELGETLTSMYMRINDMVFEPEIENEIEDVDIVEDPLIRCLFTGVFGAYQIAQLKRLKIPSNPPIAEKDLQ